MMATLGSDKPELVRLRVQAKIMPSRGNSKMGYPGSKKSIASSQMNRIFQRPTGRLATDKAAEVGNQKTGLAAILGGSGFYFKANSKPAKGLR